MTARPVPDAAGPSAPSRPAALELREVTAGYGQGDVVSDVSIAIPAGSVTALLGANGTGKTTLLRVASGLLRPTSGSVYVGGQCVDRLTPADRLKAGLCLIPEGRGIFRSLTVAENLELFLPPWSRDRDLTVALDAFPVLKERLKQTSGTLSGGQQQMLALARAYLSGASVVLLDEVSMGLAPIVVAEMFDSISALAGLGVALLIVEQYVERALAISHHAYVLERGQITFDGPASELADAGIRDMYLGRVGTS